MPNDKPNFGTELKGAINHKLDEAGLSQQDYVKAALKWQYNWIGLAGAAAFAVVSGTGLPLVLAAGLELMYVALVPQSSRFRRLVRSWKYASEKQEHTKRLEEMYKNLPPEMRSRYAFVQQVAQAIRTNYQQLSASSQVFARQMAERLDGLLEGYVRLLFTANTHREYLKSLNPDQVRSEVAFLEKSLEKNAPKVQEINRRRIEILRKRVTKFEKIQENRQVIDAQCAAIEDVLQLIRDQSVTMRDPQEVSAQLENLVQDVEQTEQSVREMEEIYALTAQENDELRLPEAGGEPPQQNRVRN
jgi:chromosome segregation ATPase